MQPKVSFVAALMIFYIFLVKEYAFVFYSIRDLLWLE